MNTLACAAVIPLVVAVVALVVHHGDRIGRGRAGHGRARRGTARPGMAWNGRQFVHLSARDQSHLRVGYPRAGIPGATRAEVGHRPSRGEPSARAGSLSFPRVTDGPGLKRVL